MPNRKSVKTIDTAGPIAATEPAAVAADNGRDHPPAADGASPTLTALSAALTAHTGRTTAELAQAAKVGQSTAAKILASLEKRGAVRRIKGGRQGARLLPDRWEPVVPTEADEGEQTLPAAELPEATASPEPTRESEAVEPAAAAATEPEEPDAPGSAEGDEIGGAPAAPAAPEMAAGPQASVEPDSPADAESDSGTDRDAEPRPKGGAEKPSGDDSARLRPGALREMVVAYMRDHADEELSPSALGKALDRSSGAIANALEKLEADSIVSQTSAKPRRYRYLGSGAKTD